MKRPLVALLLAAGCSRRAAPPAPPDARAPAAAADVAPADVARFHVCYGAGGAAVELPVDRPCASVGASDRVPDYAPAAPPPARRDAAAAIP